MEDYHFSGGEVGAERGSDVPTVAKLEKEPKV